MPDFGSDATFARGGKRTIRPMFRKGMSRRMSQPSNVNLVDVGTFYHLESITRSVARGGHEYYILCGST